MRGMRKPARSRASELARLRDIVRSEIPSSSSGWKLRGPQDENVFDSRKASFRSVRPLPARPSHPRGQVPRGYRREKCVSDELCRGTPGLNTGMRLLAARGAAISPSSQFPPMPGTSIPTENDLRGDRRANQHSVN